MGDGDHGDVGVRQGQARHTGSRLHRPARRVAGERRLGEDDDSFALRQGPSHCVHGRSGTAAVLRRRSGVGAIDGNLPGFAHDPPQNRNREQVCSGGDSRGSPRTIGDDRHREPVKVARVVGGHQERARGRNPLGARDPRFLERAGEGERRPREQPREQRHGLRHQPSFTTLAPSALSFCMKCSYPRSMMSIPETTDSPSAASAAMRWEKPPRRSGTSMSAARSFVGP